MSEHQKLAQDWADAFADFKKRDEEFHIARRAREGAQSRVARAEKALDKIVGRNIPKKLFKTTHGIVLIEHRLRDGAEAGRAGQSESCTVEWFIDNGYPEEDIELALKHSRYWERELNEREDDQ